MEITLRDVELASERLRPILHHTRLDLSSTFSSMTGGEVYLKLENLQKTGSFKIRGASNKIAVMAEQIYGVPVREQPRVVERTRRPALPALSAVVGG